MGIRLAVGEDHLDLRLVRGAPVPLVLLNAIGESQVLALADRERHLDRVELRDRRQERRRRDEVADLNRRDAGDAVDRRVHSRPAEVQPRGLDRGRGGVDLRLRAARSLDRVVELFSC